MEITRCVDTTLSEAPLATSRQLGWSAFRTSSCTVRFTLQLARDTDGRVYSHHGSVRRPFHRRHRDERQSLSERQYFAR